MPTSLSRPTWLLLVSLVLATGVMAILAADPSTHVGFVAAAIVAGVLTVVLWRRSEINTRIVVGTALLLRLSVIWLPPVLSDDFYRYVWDGVVQAEGLNPYLYTPDAPELEALQNDDVFAHLNSRAYYTVYPPVSQLIFRVGASFYDGEWRVSYFAIKFIFAAMEFAAVLVLARMLRPSQLLLYAWNPLVVLAGAGQGHGEAALALFLSLALLAAQHRHGARAGVWLACAGWVKLYPFVLVPFLWRRFGWRGMVGFGGAAVILALPYVHTEVIPHVLQSLDLYVRYFEFNAGPYYGIKEIFRVVTGEDWSKQLGPALRTIFLLALPLLYLLDSKRAWSLRRAFATTLGAFFLAATTVHPWYLLGLLAVVAGARRPSWHWTWLSILSIGTYLLYVQMPYWPWVVLGWGGWILFAAVRYRHALLDPILRRRAREKVNILSDQLPPSGSVLDVGGGEGYVGEAIHAASGQEVEVIDILDLNRTALPHRLYDGRTMPYPDDRFDVAILVYVLHHADDAAAVLREALRVSRRVVILESTYAHRWERPLLFIADRLANFIRSEGAMRRQPTRLCTHPEWEAVFSRLPAEILVERSLGGFIHHQSLFVLRSGRSND